MLRNLFAVLTALVTALPVQATIGLCACEVPEKAPAATCCCGSGEACGMEEEAQGLTAPEEALGAPGCGAMVETAPVVPDAESVLVATVPPAQEYVPVSAGAAAIEDAPSPPSFGGPPVYLLACALRC
ncbi:MAG: hypothetical protein IT452_01770 [Planctomycetia bacterium]|nr:hypothetical protein [Planctomycetia bacterium]